ncbi:MAG TPA: hypothetical protein DFR83_21005, partial [Deltaproteobacteria bacterium]|nr:hypothetical protein [Deltaproteobacteria bacterium]
MVPLFIFVLGSASAADPLFETWKARTGLALQRTEGVQAQPAEGGMALVGRGVSLLLSPAAEPKPLQAALKAQFEPFVQAGAT